MKVLLVEDDASQARKISDKIKTTLAGDVSILGPFDDFKEALPCIKKREPEIALIDIQLYEDRYAGIHIAETIQAFNPVPVLFISGIVDHEIVDKAKGIPSSDFLEKPFDQNSFERALQRVTGGLRPVSSQEMKIAFKSRGQDRYWVKTERSTFVGLNPKDIILIEAMDHYCRIHVVGNTPVITKANLKSDILENGLAGFPQFIQLNRSIIINTNFVLKVDGNLLTVDHLPNLDKRLLTIPKEKKKEIFYALGIDT